MSDTACHIELANGTFARPYGVTKQCHFEFMSITESLEFYVMEVCSSYEIILGLN